MTNDNFAVLTDDDVALLDEACRVVGQQRASVGAVELLRRRPELVGIGIGGQLADAVLDRY